MKIIPVYTLFLCQLFLFSCNSGSDKKQLGNNTSENSIEHGCLQSAEVIDGDTVNRTFTNGIKEGRWIVYEMKSLKNTSDSVPVNIITRIKKEEGYYLHNKKVGWWKNYKGDMLADSVFYESTDN